MTTLIERAKSALENATEGPWSVDFDTWGRPRVFAGKHEIVRALSEHGLRRLKEHERAANRQLIGMSHDLARALLAAEELAAACAVQDKAVSEVVRLGAQTGSQWTRLTSANLKHRSALAAYRKATGGQP